MILCTLNSFLEVRLQLESVDDKLYITIAWIWPGLFVLIINLMHIFNLQQWYSPRVSPPPLSLISMQNKLTSVVPAGTYMQSIFSLFPRSPPPPALPSQDRYYFSVVTHHFKSCSQFSFIFKPNQFKYLQVSVSNTYQGAIIRYSQCGHRVFNTCWAERCSVLSAGW